MQIHNTLLKEFKDKKLKTEYDADVNLRYALSNPEFKQSYNKVRSLQLDYAKAQYQNKDTKEIKKQILNEKENLNKIVKKLNIDTTTLKPQYSCKKCEDLGLINGKYCDCFKAELSKRLLLNCGLDYNNLPDFDKMSLDIVKNTQQETDYINTCKIFKSYVHKLKETDKKLLFLTGGVGVGKTYILKATTHEAIKNNYYALYTTSFDLNKAFLAYHCAKLEEKNNILNKYLECDLLLIDDLGTENMLKNVTIEYLYLIINQRLESGKNTILTSNLDLEQLKELYDERISSRISNQQTCVTAFLYGDDLRKQK